jgi:cbb3-type cytochrome oxidase subunit 3
MLNATPAMIDVNTAGEIGLLSFIVIFLCVSVWTFTRTRRDVKHWADIPLDLKPEGKDQEV